MTVTFEHFINIMHAIEIIYTPALKYEFLFFWREPTASDQIHQINF